MSLQSTISKAVKSAFVSLGDLKVSTTFSKVTTSYDPSTSSTVKSSIDYTVNLVEDDNESELTPSITFDKAFILESFSVIPEPGDEILFLGTVYTILNVETIRAGSVPVVHKILVKR
jgi:hypothetical protein